MRLQKYSLLVVLLAGLGQAQEDRAAITGTVSDPSQSAIANATIVIDSKATGFHREVKSNESGIFLLPGLQIGSYDLTIRKEGFRTEQFPNFILAVGQTRTINAQMQIASSSQEVQVVAETQALEQSSSKVAGVIDSNQVSELPINGRAWTALMALVPGAMDSGGGTQKSIRFAGRGGDDNNFRFDGVDATGISNQAPNTSTRLQISSEAIAEFKVDTMLYGADTGGTNGGQVEVISKSGTNAFHGSAFEYLRNNVLNTAGPFDLGNVPPPLRLNQFGASAGGAVIKNRTFYFLTYEGLRQRLGTTLTGTVPTDSFRATVLSQSPVLAPIINAFPHGNTPILDSKGNADPNSIRFVHVGNLSQDENSGLVRIDQKISDSTNVFFRYNIDRAHLAAPSGNLRDSTLTDTAPMNGSINVSHVFSPSMFNVLQLGVNRIWNQGTTDSYFLDTTKLVNSVSVSGFDKLAQGTSTIKAPTTYTLKDDFTWVRGLHTLKAGVEIKRVIYNYSQASENALIYSSLPHFAANTLDQVNLIGGVPVHSLLKTEYFGYIQDTWKATADLTVTAGLRYEFFNAFHEQYGRDLPFDFATCGGYCPVGSEFYFPKKFNPEPRLSLAWAPKALGGKTVIRAGSGFYKGEAQLGDLNAPNDNFTQRLSLSSASFPGLSFPADSFYAAAANTAVTPRALARNLGIPTVIQWGLQVQTALPAGFILDTGYIGYHGYHQFTRWYVNGCALGTAATGCQRLLPAFGPIDIKQTDSNNHFHGWQTSIHRQLRTGWSFSANYLWSHAINDDSTGGGETDYPQINTCRTCDVASSDFDIRHTFSLNSVYQLPFGKGRAYLNQSRLASAILGGWEVSGTASARTGLPVNVTIARDATAVPDGLSVENGASFQRPNCVAGVSLVPDNQSINSWINPAVFTLPAAGTYGNCGRNLVRGPNFWQVDGAISRDFRMTERFLLVFRAEVFNMFDRAQYALPNGNFSSSSFGKITSTVNGSSPTGSGTPRQFQFAMRLKF
jgi:Carboxypeptidase regulatory-like domain